MPTSKVKLLCHLLPMWHFFAPPEYPSCRLHCHWGIHVWLDWLYFNTWPFAAPCDANFKGDAVVPSPSKVAFFVQPEFPSCRLHCHWGIRSLDWLYFNNLTICSSLAMPTSKVTPLCLLLPNVLFFCTTWLPQLSAPLSLEESMFGWTDCINTWPFAAPCDTNFKGDAVVPSPSNVLILCTTWVPQLSAPLSLEGIRLAWLIVLQDLTVCSPRSDKGDAASHLLPM